MTAYQITLLNYCAEKPNLRILYYNVDSGVFGLEYTSTNFLSLGHRDKGPAYVRNDGFMRWKWEGLTHRLDGPALVYSPQSALCSDYFVNDIACRRENYHKIVQEYINKYNLSENTSK